MSFNAVTDYPIVELGDKPDQEAPIRQCRVVAYDKDKYATVIVEGYITSIKTGYLYAEYPVPSMGTYLPHGKIPKGKRRVKYLMEAHRDAMEALPDSYE